MRTTVAPIIFEAFKIGQVGELKARASRSPSLVSLGEVISREAPPGERSIVWAGAKRVWALRRHLHAISAFARW